MTHLPIYNSDINAWITFNNYFNSQKEYLSVSLNSSNPPTVNQYTRFNFYKTTSATLLSTVATGNVEYSAGANINYLINEAVYEDSAARTFTWNAGNFPNSTTLTASTYYLYCCGSTNQGSTTIGKGCYGVSTNIPSYSYQKGGWYSTADYRVLASFIYSTGSTFGELNVYQSLCTLPNINDAIESTSYSTSAYFLMQSTKHIYYKTLGNDLPANKSYSTFDSGWVASTSFARQTFTITHNLNGNLPELITRVFISTVASDTNCHEMLPLSYGAAGGDYGITLNSISTASFQINTAPTGIAWTGSTGSVVAITVSSGWYKACIYKL